MQDQEWATQSTQVLDLLRKLERSLIEMQKEKKGYLLTGDNGFADAYKRATTDFYTYHGYLSILIANSPEQADSLANIRKGVERWIAASALPEMEAKRTGKDVAAVLGINKGEELMTEIRDMLKSFEKNETSIFEARSNAAKRERIIKTSALAILCVFAVGLLIVSNSYSFVLVRRQLAKLEGVETRIRSIIENILDGMITVDEQGVIRSMNPSAEKMFGCINNEMVGHKFTKLVPKSYGRARSAARGLRLGRSCAANGQHHPGRRPHAPPRDLPDRNFAERDGGGQAKALRRHGSRRDGAETLRNGNRGGQGKPRGDPAFHRDGVITTDVQGKIIMINKAGENLTGWSSREAIGQPLKTVFNIAIDLAAQARAQKSGYRNEAQSILLSHAGERDPAVARRGRTRHRAGRLPDSRQQK